MKKTISILLVIAALFSLVACQATPEKPAVVKKDTERLIEQAAGTDETKTGKLGMTQLGLPEGRATYETAELSGKLKITADAEVKVPNTDAMPIIKASQGLFTQEQVTGMFNFLFPGEKPRIQYGQVETKAAIQKNIMELKKQYTEGKFEGTEADYQSQLAMLEEGYKTAPETAESEGPVSDGTMTKAVDSLDLHVANDDFDFWVRTYSTKHPDLGEGYSSSLAHISFSANDEDRMYWANPTPTDGTDIPEAAKNSLTITYDQAKELCGDFFAAAGYPADAFRVDAAYIVDNTGADGIPGDAYAYNFIYTRVVGGIPLYSENESLASDDDVYSMPWDYEQIAFTVDNGGIVYIDWDDPIDIGAALEEDAALKPFNDIMDVFAGMMKTYYAVAVQDIFDGEVSLDINVDEVDLALVRIREQGGEQTDGLLVPAWVFKGYCKGTDKDGVERYLPASAAALSTWQPLGGAGSGVAVEGGGILSTLDRFYESPTEQGEHHTLLVINAIDGSIIDMSKGY